MLKIKKLNKRYSDGTQALNQVSIEIPKGVFGLLGPNGAGKSTLMNILTTLQKPDEGSIYFEGQDIFADPTKHRSKLGYLPQEFGVYSQMSAEKMLDYLALLKGIVNPKERKECVASRLDLCGLYSHRKKKLGGFSGGMKQRFGIAQALIGHPKLIIVDEPTAGLDPNERNRFYNLLSEIGGNSTVLLSTHIVEDVHHLCHQIAIIDQGQILMTSTPMEATEKLNHKILEKTVTKSELKCLQEAHKIVSTKFLYGQIQVRIYSEQKIEGFSLSPPTLEDVYFSHIFRFI